MSSRKFYNNFISLGLVQLTNFVVPILMYPYLFRTLGASYFGTMMYVFNIMLYLGAIIDYGFNVTAPRNIALCQNESSSISVIASTVLQTKLLILFGSSIVIVGVVFTVPRLLLEEKLYLFSLLYIIGNSLIPTWLFQGLEDMKHLTWINLIAKIGSVTLIVFVVNKPTDYVYVVGLFGLANVVSGIIGLIYAHFRYKVVFYIQPMSTIYRELIYGWHYFTSIFAGTAFSNSTIFIMGFFVVDEVLGKYSLAEKVTFAVWQLIGVFSQVTYPMLCKLAMKSHQEVVAFVRQYYVPFIFLILGICCTIFILSNYIVLLVAGSYQNDTATLIRILSLLPLAVCLNVPAYQVLLAYEKQRYNAVIFNWSAMLSICLTILMVYISGAIGAAWAAVLTQIGVTLALHMTLRNRFALISLW